MLPLIGVTISEKDGQPVLKPDYVRAVREAGGLPVLIPFLADEREVEELLGRLDGVLFIGSSDLDPALWGEARHPETALIHPERQRSDLALARAALARRLPTLGICGGMQLINVVLGGSLHQHLPDLQGTLVHTGEEFHDVTASAGSRLAALLGPRSRVNTSHHQAVNRLGRKLVVSAISPEDAVIEAFEAPEFPYLVGVQWHPERMPGQEALFKSLIAAASR